MVTLPQSMRAIRMEGVGRITSYICTLQPDHWPAQGAVTGPLHPIPHTLIRFSALSSHSSRVTRNVTPGVTTVHKPGQDNLALNSPHQHYKTPPAWCSCQPLICPPLVRICKYTKRRADSRFVAVELWIQHSDDNSGEYSQCSGWVC